MRKAGASSEDSQDLRFSAVCSAAGPMEASVRAGAASSSSSLPCLPLSWSWRLQSARGQWYLPWKLVGCCERGNNVSEDGPILSGFIGFLTMLLFSRRASGRDTGEQKCTGSVEIRYIKIHPIETFRWI